jgi:hypothetical protein
MENPLQLKKLYTLAAFEVGKAREKNELELTRAHGLTTLGGGFAAGNTVTTMTRAQATVQGLVTRDAAAAQVHTVHRNEQEYCSSLGAPCCAIVLLGCNDS